MRLTGRTHGPGGSGVYELAHRAGRHLRARPELVVMAASTGGPGALRELLLKLPAQLAAPVVVVQHLPPSFVASFARQLDRRLDIAVKLAEPGAAVGPNTVWFAHGDRHVVVTRGRGGELCFGEQRGPAVVGCKPAADVLFRSAARVSGAATLGVVLTGMGADGCAGAREIAAAGGQIFVQDQASSAVWGMPGAVVRAGIEARIVPLTDMAGEILGALAPAGSKRSS